MVDASGIETTFEMGRSIDCDFFKAGSESAGVVVWAGRDKASVKCFKSSGEWLNA